MSGTLNARGWPWRTIPTVLCAIASAFAGNAWADAPGARLEVLKIWPGAAPGTESWSGPEEVSHYSDGAHSVALVTNVTVPTLTVYRPKTANGTAVIVVPGGGFRTLAVEHEGEMVAHWLNAHGITAFMLKYRVRNQPELEFPLDVRGHPERFVAFSNQFAPQRPIAIADAVQAMHVLRARAARFGIAPDRIGMVGFSAGAITTVGVLLHASPADRPDFAVPVYGALMDDTPVPTDAPPIFIAAAQDDELVPVEQSVEIFRRWTSANRPAELHVYEKGGHGFGMIKFGKPVDGWPSALEAWLRSRNWIK